MSRIQLALNVSDLDAAVNFYSQLFGVEPSKRHPGYANFAISEPPLKLVLIENPERADSLNHLGIEVESIERVKAERDRLQSTGLTVSEADRSTCCCALQDKFWVRDPDCENWEIYTVLADAATFGTNPNPTKQSGICCA